MMYAMAVPSSQSDLLNSGKAQVGQEGRLTPLDEALRQIRKLKERWHDSLSVESLRLAEYYCEGRIEIIVELDVLIIRSGGDINFGRERPAVRLRLKVEAPERQNFVANRDIHPSEVNARNRWNKQFVFVHDVKLVESAQGPLTAIVGFQLLNQAKRVG